jgi:hypothetical protein
MTVHQIKPFWESKEEMYNNMFTTELICLQYHSSSSRKYVHYATAPL